MKLIRFGNANNEKPGILDLNGIRRDASSLIKDWDRETLNQTHLADLFHKLRASDTLPIVDESERWASCVARPGKVICIGLNYSDHAAEAGMQVPSEPIVFQKGSNTVVGPYDNIIIPRTSEKTDWEVELGVVISKDARYLSSPEEAKDYILGYCISNDVSERAFQLERGGQWTKGKSCDNFNPLGPFLATADEIEDPQNLSMSLDVNGQRMQTGNSSFMVFDCYFLVYYLSQFMTLEAGDVISTGTPPGVGMGLKPPTYLKAGDIVELTIKGLGKQRQVCVDA